MIAFLGTGHYFLPGVGRFLLSNRYHHETGTFYSQTLCYYLVMKISEFTSLIGYGFFIIQTNKFRYIHA